MRPAAAAVAVATAATALATVAPDAGGSPLDDPTTGRAVFTGAATPHATSILLDPAALALGLTGFHIYVGGTLTLDQLAIDRSEIDLATGQLSPGEKVRALGIGPGGTFGLWTVTASRNLAAGLLLLSPARAPPFPEDEPGLGYHSLGGVHRTTELATLAAAYRVIRRFYVGGAVSLTRNRVRLSFLRDTALEAGRDAVRGIASDCGGAPCGVENPLAAERYAIDAFPTSLFAAENLTVRISALIELYPQWWFGATYRFASTAVSLEGSAVVTGAPREGSVVRRGDALILFDLPSTIDAELRGRISSGFDLHVGGHYEDLDSFRSYDVRLLGFPAEIPDWIERPRGYNDLVRMWAGVEQVDIGVERPFLWGARVGFATPEVTLARLSPTTAARWSLTADVGGQVRVAGLVIQLGYGLDYRPSATSADSDYNPIDRLACIDSGFDYSTTACQHVREGYAIPTAAGTYRRLTHALRLGLRYDFR
jgi:hypothetical protein